MLLAIKNTVEIRGNSDPETQAARLSYGPGRSRHLVAVAQNGGLRSIMEGILLDTMFDLPSLEGVEEVVISKEVVEGTARPLYIYTDRASEATA